MLYLLLLLTLLFLTFFLSRLLYVLAQIHRSPAALHSRTRCTASLLTVAGSGGHTAELLQLLEAVFTSTCARYSPRHYIVADTDAMSQDKIESFERERRADVIIAKIPRAREVGQSYISSVLTTLWSQLCCVPCVVRARPDVVLVNGPGTCIPVCALVFLLRVLGVCKGRIVYVESICRVKTLSLSARILLLFADHVLVQWRQLHDKHPRCTYIGRLVS